MAADDLMQQLAMAMMQGRGAEFTQGQQPNIRNGDGSDGTFGGAPVNPGIPGVQATMPNVQESVPEIPGAQGRMNIQSVPGNFPFYTGTSDQPGSSFDPGPMGGAGGRLSEAGYGGWGGFAPSGGGRRGAFPSAPPAPSLGPPRYDKDAWPATVAINPNAFADYDRGGYDAGPMGGAGGRLSEAGYGGWGAANHAGLGARNAVGPQQAIYIDPLTGDVLRDKQGASGETGGSPGQGSVGGTTGAGLGGMGEMAGSVWHEGGYVSDDGDGMREDVPDQTLQEHEQVLTGGSTDLLGADFAEQVNAIAEDESLDQEGKMQALGDLFDGLMESLGGTEGHEEMDDMPEGRHKLAMVMMKKAA